MKPQENFNNEPTAEGLAPEMEREMPTADFGAENNGMYDSAEEAEAARDAYVIPESPIRFSGENDYPAPALVSEELDTTETLSDNLPAEVTESEEIAEAVPENVGVEDADIIDVEAREVTSSNESEAVDLESTEATLDLESDDETDDIADAFDKNERLNVGGQSLELTPKLKQLSKNIFDSMGSMFSSGESELPEEIDWRLHIQSEPDYDESYDIDLLAKIYQTRYERKRAAWLSEKYIGQIKAESKFGPPPIPPEGPAVAAAEGAPSEKPPTETAESQLAIEHSGDPLAIEYEKPAEAKGTPLQIEQ